MKKIEKIIQLLKRGDTQEALNEFWILLEAFQKNTHEKDAIEYIQKLRNDLIVLSADQVDIKKKYLIGTISESNYNVRKNRLLDSILKLVKQFRQFKKKSNFGSIEPLVNSDINEFKNKLSKDSISKPKLELSNALYSIGLILLVTLTWYSINQIKEHNKKGNSMVIIQEAPEKLKNFRNALDNIRIKEWYDGKMGTPLNEVEAKLLINACSADKDSNPDSNPFSCEDKINVYNFLNYMESICVGYTNNICNKKMIETSFGDIGIEAFIFFEKLIQIRSQDPQLKTPPWEPFQKFVSEYTKKNIS